MRLACSSESLDGGEGEENGLELGIYGNGDRERRAGERYDHTDMEDVNGLIEEYRRMSLGTCM